MNQKIVALCLVVCLAGSTFAQNDLMTMMMFSKMFGQPPMDASMAQNTNQIPGAGGAGPQTPGGPQTSPGQGRPMIQRVMLPMMMGLDFNDPLMWMFMSGAGGM